MRRIDGVIKSAETKYIMLNAPKDKVAAITELLPGSDSPTIIPLAGTDNLVALQAVCTPEDQKNAINTARKNIKKFHKAQIPSDIEVETTKGVICRREPRPLETAGLYVPGGTAPLVSTLLMLAIPAEVAGVRHRIVVTPPGNLSL